MPLKKVQIKFNGSKFRSQEHAYWCSMTGGDIGDALRTIDNPRSVRTLGSAILGSSILPKEEEQLRKIVFKNMVLQHESLRRIFISSEPNECLMEVLDEVKDIPFSQLEIFDEEPRSGEIESCNQD